MEVLREVYAFLAQQLPSVPSDPIMFFVGQGVLGIVCYVLYRDNRDLRKQNESLYERVMDQHIPLLTRATIAIERAAKHLEEER